MSDKLFTPHGGYRTLDTFMFSTIIYYGTVAFCRKYIQGGRQVEQMVQAARSGRQNIAEGSERSATSTHTEIQLTDVACASLAELQLDYEDFIHFSGADPWADDDENSLAIRQTRLEFREDLYYRLNVIPIRVPPLREHPEDINAIANGFWLRLYRYRLAAEQLVALRNYVWPGNVCELFNVFERASVTGEEDFSKLLAEHLALSLPLSEKQAASYPDNLEAAVRAHVRSVYECHDGNLSQTAAVLGVSRNTARKYFVDLNRPDST